jgi:hypothetical protein
MSAIAVATGLFPFLKRKKTVKRYYGLPRYYGLSVSEEVRNAVLDMNTLKQQLLELLKIANQKNT